MLPICSNVKEAVAAIRAAPLENLRSAAWLEHEFLPGLGLHELVRVKKSLVPYIGKGIRSWQSPAQFSKYLVHLAGLKISSYLEIGVSHGGTLIITTEYLARFSGDLVCSGIDIELQRIVQTYQEENSRISLHQLSTRSPEAGRLVSSRLWDLVLIDGDHTEEGCQFDYDLVKNNARHIAFHDITHDRKPGVGNVWRRITASTPARYFFEFVDQYAETIIESRGEKDYGIGVLHYDR